LLVAFGLVLQKNVTSEQDILRVEATDSVVRKVSFILLVPVELKGFLHLQQCTLIVHTLGEITETVVSKRLTSTTFFWHYLSRVTLTTSSRSRGPSNSISTIRCQVPSTILPRSNGSATDVPMSADRM
jgi:hypothetical protein